MPRFAWGPRRFSSLCQPPEPGSPSMCWDSNPTPTPGTSIEQESQEQNGSPSPVTFHQHQGHVSQDGQGCPQDQDGEEEGADGVYVLVLWLQEKGKAELGFNT